MLHILLWVFLALGQEREVVASSPVPPDSAELRFEIGSPFVKSPIELNKRAVIDLKSPSNTRTEVRYDPLTRRYIFENKIGDRVVALPFSMSPDEYMQYRRRLLQTEYFRSRNAMGGDTLSPLPRVSLRDIRRPTSPTGEIFGIGDLKLVAKGTLELSAGLKRDVTHNPTLPQRARRRTTFDMGQDIRVNLSAQLGEKIHFDIHYDSHAPFDMDARKIHLGYRGDEDEIIQYIEAGNVGMVTSNSLINAGEALFGIKAGFQFGKLRINTLLSQQESEIRTVNSSGGVQTIPFEFSADAYDENRHFFMGYHFRDTYDEALESLPYVQSPVNIARVEVWVTNRRGDYNQSRNIVAFADLGEHEVLHHPLWSPSGSQPLPYNRANTLYPLLVDQFSGAREIANTERVFPPEVVAGRDYEKLENARLLDPSEYTIQPQLGYITLRIPLQPDEVLAIAYEYTVNGEAYQVGEFARDVEQGALFVKLLKPASLSPASFTWDLMMKNVYSLGNHVFDIERDRFKLDISYRSDSTGTWLEYLPGVGDVGTGERLLQMMHLDRLNDRGDPYPDGLFDFIDGLTIDTDNGVIVFPVVEPFGANLRRRIGDEELADKYTFQALYDSTRTAARQLPEKNKYRLTGEYRGSSSSDINLHAFNIPPGSVQVMAGGVELTEGTDFMVDYLSGTLSIINPSILSAGTPIRVSLEDRSLSRMQRKTLAGIDLQYDLSKNLTLGGTLMHYREKPLVTKSAYGEESARNTLWGANLAYRKESLALTNLLDRVPFVDASEPSTFSTRWEFAQLIPGHYTDKHTGAYSYLDDFETSITGIDLRSPHAWSLAATPYHSGAEGLFPEASLSNHPDYGKNRARLAWFFIDGMFTRPHAGLTPAHIRNDPAQLSDHRVREVLEREIFPNREPYHGQPSSIPVLNLSYYPSERGPYNLDTNVDSEGRLLDPSQRWGGITRRMDIRDFEEANIEYIEFWLMDPFVYDTLGTARGGDLYFNLGDISEDVLKDGKKFFENGLPVDGDTASVGYSVWGKYPKRQSTVYAFDNSLGMESRRLQDVGLNGLSTEEELVFPTYAEYLEELRVRLPAETLSRMEEDPHSPLNDPAGDTFRHYRGVEQDQQQLSILERYKHYNNTEGNSIAAEDNPYSSTARTTPDTEDIDGDNTMNVNEAYYQYRVSLRPESMRVGINYITDKREASVRLKDGSDASVTWYQFKVPIRDFQSKTGSIQGFNNIRFMRLFLTNFHEPAFLRFATLELVRGEWRAYQKDMETGSALSGTGQLDLSAVNIEENSNRSPVNYVVPPGVSRSIDPGQPQLRQQNEQSLSLKASDLEPGQARAVYKNTTYDVRRHKRLQMFVHAERDAEDPAMLQDGDVSIFLRIGSDYRDNYYEYEIPLKITPEGQYSTYSEGDRHKVWPEENRFDFPLHLFTDLKLERDTHPGNGASPSPRVPYSKMDPEKPANQVSIKGNPTLSEVNVMMIGLKNRSEGLRSIEVWVNELRLSEFDEQGGWAAQGEVQLTLSDLGSIHVSGRKETAGFGALSHQLMQRRRDDYQSLHFMLNLDLGRFLPRQARITAPLYYSYSSHHSSPLYDPFNQDIFLSESLQRVTERQRDSLRLRTHTHSFNKSLSLTNARANIRSKNPMPYDPANVSFTYAYTLSSHKDPETVYANTREQRLQANYLYIPEISPWHPFKTKAFWLRPLPNQWQWRTNLSRRYQERQLRDLNTYPSNETGLIDEKKAGLLSFGGSFFWDRDLSITWDPTPHLKASFRSGTLAEIEEPYLQVNKEINRDDYEIWRDSVAHHLKKLGTPYRYEQSADLTYTLPFSYLKALDWVNASAVYHSRYRWDRGARVEGREMGNHLQNDLSLTFNSRLNLVGLYDKFSLPRAAMIMRSLSLNYSYRTRTDIPGFDPMIGDLFGQQGTAGGLVPGLSFAFGLHGGERFIKESLEKGRLVTRTDHVRPALYNRTGLLRVEANLELLQGLTIALQGLYEDNRRTEFLYSVDGMPQIFGGSFAMSTISLSSAFERGRAGNNYRSPAFDRFLANRETIAQRLDTRYRLSDGDGDGISAQSGDVLIPAFLAAYTGRDPSKAPLTPFPNVRSLLPNWNATYNVMTLVPELQDLLRSLFVSHGYRAQYRIGSYSSFQSWVPLTEGSELGYSRDPVTGLLRPSSRYDISSATIIESFNPLFEVSSTLHNQLNFSIRFNRTRALNLNIGAHQLVETRENDVVAGMGYRVPKLNDVVLRFDASRKITRSLIRKIDDGFTQATSGMRSTSIRFTADYAISRKLTLRAYYDTIMYTPLVSSFSYPHSVSNAGINVQINLGAI